MKNTKKSQFKRSALSIAIAAAVSANVAYGEEIKKLPDVEVSAQAESGYKVDKLSSNKYSQPLLKTPKTIMVIPEYVMKDRGATTLRDSLRGASGIAMSAGEGGAPTGDNMTIRGFSAKTDIFVDGIRDIAGYSRDIYNVEAIEVTKGPGSSISGRGSVGGSINMAMKKARLENFNDFAVGGGLENNYRVTLDSNIAVGDTTALRFNALTTDGDVAGRNEINNGMNAAALSLAAGLGTDSRITLSAEYQDQDRLPDYGLPWVPNYASRTDRRVDGSLARFVGKSPPVSFDNFYGNVHRDFEAIEATSIIGLYEKDLSENSMLYFRAGYRLVERKSITTAPRFKSRCTIALDVDNKCNGVNIYGLDGLRLDDQKTRDQETSMLALQTAWIATIGRHDFSVGAEYYHEKDKLYSLDDNGTDNLLALTNDLYKPNPFRAYSGRYIRDIGNKKQRNIEGEGTTYALYAFDTLRLHEKLALNAGLRYEYYESETEGYHRGEKKDMTLTRDDKMLSWNAGVVYNIHDNGTVYFGAGNSFNPAAEDLTASLYGGNETTLDPEESFSYELGTKWELFGDRLLVSAALFRTEKTNARSDDPDHDDTRANTLDGEQRVQGLELSGFGQITSQFAVTASYTFQDSEVIKASGEDKAQIGHELRRTPKNSFSIWTTYLPVPKLKTGLGLEYVGERFNSSDPGGRERAPDYYLLDMMMSYQFTKQVTLQFNGNNIADERYIDLVGGGHFVPGAGRSFSLRIDYSF